MCVKVTKLLLSIAAVLGGIVAIVAIAVLATSGEYPPGPHPTMPESPAEFRAVATRASLATPTVVVLVFDGLAPSLVRAHATPALDRIGREGAWTHNMVPPFPTISLISGFTISTGCWPERHGIVTNRFFDPERGFYDHSKDADWVLECEQLHEAAERQGVPTATLGWYGEVSSTRGKLARIVEYNAHREDHPTDAERAEQVAQLLALPEGQAPKLILAYFGGPDGPAHFRGMESEEVADAVAETDRAVGRVLRAIEETGLAQSSVLIVTTDHGMLPVTHLVNAGYILRKHGIEGRMVATGSTAFLYLGDPSEIEAVEKALSTYEQFDLIRPTRQPEWSHLGTGPRSGDLILSAKPGFAIEDRGQLPWYLRWLAWTGPEILATGSFLRATHGYPPDTPGVQGVFYAWGAGIRRNQRLERVDAIDIHPTITHVMGIQPGEPVDGKVVRDLLAETSPETGTIERDGYPGRL